MNKQFERFCEFDLEEMHQRLAHAKGSLESFCEKNPCLTKDQWNLFDAALKELRYILR